MTPGLIVILHDQVSIDAPADQQDTLEQVKVVTQALKQQGYLVRTLALHLDLGSMRQQLCALAPSLVVNLAESLAGDGSLVHLPAQLLEGLELPFTGCPSEALYLTTNKPLCKRLLRCSGLPTPDWLGAGTELTEAAVGSEPWLVKSVHEEASLGMDGGALVTGPEALEARLTASGQHHGGVWFAERYIEGRELNVALLDGAEGPEVLPIAEVCFIDFPPQMPRILDYAAKWNTESFAYRHSQRRFIETDTGLYRELSGLARDCWALFGLRGYARVDFRVDVAGRPWIIEINANPCIAPDAGFTAAAARAGLNLSSIVARLLNAASSSRH
jgi:D-alanine-D-alanine ligase